MLTPTKAWTCGMDRTNGSYWKDGLLKYKLWKCVRVEIKIMQKLRRSHLPPLNLASGMRMVHGTEMA